MATIAEAAEDHRASSGRPPRTIYGRIVAEADRVIDCETTLRRTVQYGLEHAPELDREGQFARFAEHLRKGENRYGADPTAEIPAADAGDAECVTDRLT